MIALKPNREKSVENHHPWIFSGAIEKVDNPKVARIDQIVDSNNRFVAWGYYDPDSHIIVHVLSYEEQEKPDETWWAQMLKASIARRMNFFSQGPKPKTTVFRIVHSEADFLGGLVVDVYAKIVRVTISSRLAYAFKEITIKTIDSLLKPNLIILNTDSAFTAIEKLSSEIEYYKEGARWYPSSKLEPIVIRENDMLYSLVPGTGQKSGFYCDQRNNRVAIEKYCENKAVLDGCCYTGGFTLHALKAGAKSVDALDSSDDALHMLLSNVNLNEQHGIIPQGSRAKVTTQKCDIFEQIREIKKGFYDLIILDPPKLANTKGALEKAQRAYKDLNRVAMQRIKNGGVLVSCSCSSAMTLEQFKLTLSWAAKDAGVEIQILEVLTQAEDHPIRLSFPESDYLKALVMRVIK